MKLNVFRVRLDFAVRENLANGFFGVGGAEGVENALFGDVVDFSLKAFCGRVEDFKALDYVD